MELRPYQEKLAYDTASALANGKRRVITQLATGGGKTITFAAITNRYVNKSGRSVLITVHREELLQQTIRTLHKAYGITAEVVGKDMQPAQVYVAMVETLNNRLKKGAQFNDVGLLIFDEAHLAHHLKILEYFQDSYILGFTATPVSASKKRPLNAFFEDIVCGIDIPDLIKGGNLVKNVTVNPKGAISRKELSVKNGEFDDKVMGAAYSRPKQVENTIVAYNEFAIGTKTIIFNCNIDHSKTVNERFQSEGLPSEHLDGTTTPQHRKDVLQWFKETPDAILNNVGILTTGFDEPSVQTIMVNKDTLSLPLWLQMCGRGSRPYDGKRYFRIIDLGTNAESMGDWDFARDWQYLFHNPGRAKDGIAPVKKCPECMGIVHAAAKVCEQPKMDGGCCTYIFPEKLSVEMPIEFKIYSKNIDVNNFIADNTHRKEYYSFFKLPYLVVNAARRAGVKNISEEMYQELLKETNRVCKEWCREKDKRYNDWHKKHATIQLDSSLKTIFKWQPAQ